MSEQYPAGGKGHAPSGIRVLDQAVDPAEKARYVQLMFDAIAPRYDLLNNVLSVGIHHLWRSFAVRCAALTQGDAALDVCAGTGDVGALLRRAVGPGGRVVSVDFSMPMLRAGDARYAESGSARAQVDAVCLPFADESFDAALVAFGLRNVAQPALAVAEMRRVVKPGGRVVVLEFAQPHFGWFNSVYEAYSKYGMPLIGGLISGRREAYSYLPESVARWKSRSELIEIMRDAGLREPRLRDLTFGMVCVHTGTR